MPRPRVAMRKIKEVLRLTLAEGLSRRQVVAAAGLPYATVARYLTRAAAAGISWPLPADLDDAALGSGPPLRTAAPPRRPPGGGSDPPPGSVAGPL